MSAAASDAHTPAVERVLTAASGPAPGYEPDDACDEAFLAAAPRPQYAGLLERLADEDLGALQQRVNAAAGACGMDFGGSADPRPFRVDPVPRLVSAEEWALLERGLAQRLRALNAFVADVYDGGEIVTAGVVPERVIETAVRADPGARGIPAPAAGHVTVAGFDIVRDADGRLLVLEDNLRTPSGLAYAAAVGEIVGAELGGGLPASRDEPSVTELLGEALAAAVPGLEGEPRVVLLSDGPANSAWWEHRWLAERMGLELVQPGDLEQRRGRVIARLGDGETVPVDRIYRRTDASQLIGAGGESSWLGELLLEPLRRGAVACANCFGTGIADDKLVHAYVEEMIGFYLGEQPAIRSVGTYDLGDPDIRRRVLERIDELVIKPRDGYGGEGVVICAHAREEDRARAAALVSERPERVVAQETIQVSTHPTVVEGELRPRHVDLRAFAFATDAGAKVLPGGLTRVAFDAGALVVNSTQNGGGKATWMLR